jgi:hypothetical protein
MALLGLLLSQIAGEISHQPKLLLNLVSHDEEDLRSVMAQAKDHKDIVPTLAKSKTSVRR